MESFEIIGVVTPTGVPELLEVYQVDLKSFWHPNYADRYKQLIYFHIAGETTCV